MCGLISIQSVSVVSLLEKITGLRRRNARRLFPETMHLGSTFGVRAQEFILRAG